MPAPSNGLPAWAIAMSRFGLGARSGERVPADPRAWLHAQLSAYDLRPAGLGTTTPGAQLISGYQVERQASTLR